jgi:membrane associated rhomboid family serine protease
MGIYSRDYLREDDYRGGGLHRDFDPIKWIIVVNVAVFVIQIIAPQITDWCALNASAISGGQVWRLLTYEFLHETRTPWHIFFNMYFLYLAGRKVEQHYGSREFLFFYIAAGVLSGLFSVMWYQVFGVPGWSAIGASGAVAAVFILYALRWPHDLFYLFGIIPVQAMWLAILDVILDVHPLLLDIAGANRDRVAHAAHVGGMLFALFYYRRDWRLAPIIDRFRGSGVKRVFKSRTKLRVYEPEATTVDPEARLDELLAKVAEHGESSLTDSERAELVDFSRRFRNRERRS